MAATTHPHTIDGAEQEIAHAGTHPQQAHASSGIDVGNAIDAHEANLATYLNQPVQDILSRLGLPPLSSHPDTDGAETPPGTASPVDPNQMIKPATDALGTLGNGQFNNADPTQMFQQISQAFESAAQPLGEALSQ